MKALDGLSFNEGQLLIAYEPVWAIGTGDPCDPAKADEMHMWISNEIKQYTEVDVPILYGGSVNEENVVSYLSSKNVSGVLDGGASTKVESLTKMIDLASKS